MLGMTEEGLAPFVRRREQTTGLTYVAKVHNIAQGEETITPELYSIGASAFTPAPDPIRQSQFLGGKGRPAYPSKDDSVYYLNPWTMLGGEGASWEWEHFGYKVPALPPTKGADNPSTYGGANHPLDGHAGMVAWPERANEYRPPWESFGGLVDQRTGNVAPDWSNARGANPLV